MAKIITATIDPVTGEVAIDLAGYEGNGCHAVQDAFTKGLGGKTLMGQKKPYIPGLHTNTCVTR